MTASEKKVDHIRQHPEKHQHTFVELQKCCFVNGAVDMQVLEAHSTYAPAGRNGSLKCDVTHGPCSCGAYH